MKIYELETKYVAVGCAKYLKKIQSPADMAEYLQGAFDAHIDQEQFWIILLNSDNRPLARHMATLGLTNQTQIHSREAFRFAIRENAVAVIFAHNHPSGNLSPSTQDIQTTQELVNAGKLLNIEVLDHIIMTDENYYSIRTNKSYLFS